jgi:hypothetical protein
LALRDFHFHWRCFDAERGGTNSGALVSANQSRACGASPNFTRSKD